MIVILGHLLLGFIILYSWYLVIVSYYLVDISKGGICVRGRGSLNTVIGFSVVTGLISWLRKVVWLSHWCGRLTRWWLVFDRSFSVLWDRSLSSLQRWGHSLFVLIISSIYRILFCYSWVFLSLWASWVLHWFLCFTHFFCCSWMLGPMGLHNANIRNRIALEFVGNKLISGFFVCISMWFLTMRLSEEAVSLTRTIERFVSLNHLWSLKGLHVYVALRLLRTCFWLLRGILWACVFEVISLWRSV